MKKILVLLCGVLFASNLVKAAELSNPFYIPAKGKLASVTQISYEKTHTQKESFGNNFRTRNKAFEERFEYGISPKVAIIGTIANTWKRQKPDNLSVTDKTDENINWSVGSMYDLYNKDDVHFHLELLYLQNETHHFGGAYKAFHANAKAGYDLKYFLPYLGGQIELPIAQRKDADHDLKYDAYAGIYKYFFDIVAIDATIHYSYNHFSKSTKLNERIDLNFLINENIALGGFFDYTFFDHAKNQAHTNAHIIGATVKVQF